MTLRTLVRFTACSNGGKKFSRSVRTEMSAGPTLVPLSRLAVAGHVLQGRENVTRCERKIVACRPFTAATPISPTR